MLSHGKAGIDPGRWAYATLPKHSISKHLLLPWQGLWPLLWSLEVQVARCVRRQDRRRSVVGSGRTHRGLDKSLLDGGRFPHEQRRIIGDHGLGWRLLGLDADVECGHHLAVEAHQRHG